VRWRRPAVGGTAVIRRDARGVAVEVVDDVVRHEEDEELVEAFSLDVP
jgi:hypothetical protein